MSELDRRRVGPGFDRWLERWRDRWIAGERIRVEIARDYSHAVVVADVDAPVPGPVTRAQSVQLALDVGPLDDVELDDD